MLAVLLGGAGVFDDLKYQSVIGRSLVGFSELSLPLSSAHVALWRFDHS